MEVVERQRLQRRQRRRWEVEGMEGGEDGGVLKTDTGGVIGT